MNRTSCIIILLLPSILALGQIPNITRWQTVDSLTELLTEAEGTRRVDLLNRISLELSPRSPDSGFRYASEALDLSTVLNYTRGKGIAIFNIGNSYFFKTDIRNALTKYFEARRILEPYEPTREIADLLYQLGSINEYVRNTRKISEYYLRSARNYQDIGDTARAALTYMTLGASYYYRFQALPQVETMPKTDRVSMMDSAIKYNDLARDYFLVPHEEYPWGTSQELWLSNVYNYYGCYYQSKGDTAALDHFRKALDMAGEIADSKGRMFMEGLLYVNLSDYYHYYKNNLDTGLIYAIKGVELLKNSDRIDTYSASLAILGDIYRDMGRYQDAETYLLKALNASDTFLLKVNEIEDPDPNFRLWAKTQMHSLRLGIFSRLVLLYTKTNDYKSGLRYQKMLGKERAIQSREELSRQIIGLETEYEEDLKMSAIAGLAKDNELNRLKLKQNKIVFASIGAASLIILLFILLWIQRKRFHSETKARLLEQRLLRAQMNPHFIFNSLYSIQNFIVTEKPEKASIYLSKFASLVRNILDNSTEEYVALEKEISTIENYLELQKVRYAGKFDYRIDIADEIDAEMLLIPPMLAQPFIENAIEHGIKHRETPGHIAIRFSLQDHTLIFEVEDNGVGRQKARELENMQIPDHRSMATSLTRERLVNLNRKLHKKIFLEIIDLKNNLGEAAGTRVVFGVPEQ